MQIRLFSGETKVTRCAMITLVGKSMWTVIQRRTTPWRRTQRHWSPSIFKKPTSRWDNPWRNLADFQKPRWPWCTSRCLATIVKLTRWIPQNIIGSHSSSEWPHGSYRFNKTRLLGRSVPYLQRFGPYVSMTHSRFFEGAGFWRATKQHHIYQIHHEARKRQRTSFFERHGKKDSGWKDDNYGFLSGYKQASVAPQKKSSGMSEKGAQSGQATVKIWKKTPDTQAGLETDRPHQLAAIKCQTGYDIMYSDNLGKHAWHPLAKCLHPSGTHTEKVCSETNWQKPYAHLTRSQNGWW